MIQKRINFKIALFICLLLLFIVVVFSWFVQKQTEAIEAYTPFNLYTKGFENSKDLFEEQETIEETEEDIGLFDTFPDLLKIDPEKAEGDCFILPKWDEKSLSLQVKDSPVDFKVSLTIKGISKEKFLEAENCYRKKEDHCFSGEPKGKGDLIRRIRFEEPKKMPEGDFSQQITLWMKHVYEYEILEDESYFYILLHRPRELYDKLVVVDAGHGGTDPGTVAAGTSHYEKKYNLEVLLELKKLLDQESDIRVFYTRITDRRLTLNQRVDLANDLGADLFLSIHCNSSDYTSANGTEVIYNDKDDKKEGFYSKQWAALCLEKVNLRFPLKNRGLIPTSERNIFIVRTAKMPVALLEMGYLSNDQDLHQISKKSNQEKIAQGILEAMESAFERRATCVYK